MNVYNVGVVDNNICNSFHYIIDEAITCTAHADGNNWYP